MKNKVLIVLLLIGSIVALFFSLILIFKNKTDENAPVAKRPESKVSQSRAQSRTIETDRGSEEGDRSSEEEAANSTL